MAVRRIRIILDVEEKGLNPLKPHSKLHKGMLVGTPASVPVKKAGLKQLPKGDDQ